MSKDDRVEIGKDLVVESRNLYGLLEVNCRLLKLGDNERLLGPSQE